MKLKGEWATRKVWLDGKLLSPKRSQRVKNHSPDGFNWSYEGSGPAQLALTVMLKFFPEEEAVHLYQGFKRDVIAGLPKSDFELEMDIYQWRERQSSVHR